MQKIGFYFRTCLALTLVLIAGIYFVPDPTSLKTALFAVAVALLITTVIVLVLGVKDRWGVLPALDFHRDVGLALSTPLSAAIVFAGFLLFLGMLVIAVFKAS
jgi:magnesium-transporting ATPase (P-type)